MWIHLLNITCSFLPPRPSAGTHARNSQFVSWQTKLPWGNKRQRMHCKWMIFGICQRLLSESVYINVTYLHQCAGNTLWTQRDSTLSSSSSYSSTHTGLQEHWQFNQSVFRVIWPERFPPSLEQNLSWCAQSSVCWEARKLNYKKHFILLMGLQRGDWGQSMASSWYQPRMMEKEGCSSSQGYSMETTVESFSSSWAWQGLPAQLKMEQAVSGTGSHPESSGHF